MGDGDSSDGSGAKLNLSFRFTFLDGKKVSESFSRDVNIETLQKWIMEWLMENDEKWKVANPKADSRLVRCIVYGRDLTRGSPSAKLLDGINPIMLKQGSATHYVDVMMRPQGKSSRQGKTGTVGDSSAVGERQRSSRSVGSERGGSGNSNEIDELGGDEGDSNNQVSAVGGAGSRGCCIIC